MDDIMRVIRSKMINNAVDLLDGSPDVSGGEYTRGMVELIVNTTLGPDDCADSMRQYVEGTINAMVDAKNY